MEWFIQLHRKMLDWEWYDDINTKVLFIHLLLKANWKEKQWRWIDIGRWEFLTSFWKLSEETGLSIQQIRTSINKLKSTGEITQQSHASYSIIKLRNYDEYQTSNTEDNKIATYEQQATNKPVTTTNKDNKEKKENKDNKYIYLWEFWKVKVTEKELENLKIRYDENVVNDLIDKLDRYIWSKWDKYKSHYLTMINWAKRDGITEYTIQDRKEQKERAERRKMVLNEKEELPVLNIIQKRSYSPEEQLKKIAELKKNSNLYSKS